MRLRQPIWIGYFNQSVFTAFTVYADQCHVRKPQTADQTIYVFY